MIIRCRRQLRGMSGLSDDYWAEAAGGERFRVESETFTGDLPKKIGPYEIRKFVARGGMGIVLQGLHEETAHLAAVKLPTPDLNKDHQWLKRFEQEVRTLKSVTHPNLVRLQDAGQEGELHWMAMDWVEGGTVGERLAAYKEAREPMPLSEIQLVLRQVVEGLMTLHSKGVVHRDLKPGNLLVGQDGGVKVADFGLAKQVGGEQSTFLTRTGTFAGTMYYMAPEQAEGMGITPAADIYALGVIWYELLTSKRPSGKFKLAKLRPDCPRQWASLIEDCLDDEPTDRPGLSLIQQALMAEDFEAVIPPTELEQEETSPTADPETEQEQLPREELEPESIIEVKAPEPEARKEDPLPEYEGRVAEVEESTKVKAPVGLELWEFETGDSVSSSPAIGSDGMVYVGSDDKKLYAINGKSGVKLWEFKTGGWFLGNAIFSPAIGSDGTVYVGSDDKKLYAIKTDPKGLAKSPWPMFGQNARHAGRVMKK